MTRAWCSGGNRIGAPKTSLWKELQMATSHSILSAALMVAVLAGGTTALAQQGPGMMGPGMMRDSRGPGGMGWGMGHGGMQRGMGYGMMGGGCPMFGDAGSTYTDGRLAFLKAELGITDAQKSAWDAYAAALRRNLENMQAMHATMRQSMEQEKSPVERLDTHVTTMEARLTALKEMKPALTTLYGAMTDDQKKKAGELLTGMGCMM
jgi:hypothetical protein